MTTNASIIAAMLLSNSRQLQNGLHPPDEAMKTFWCLYRESPFRILLRNGKGFATPSRDMPLGILWSFPSESEARIVQRFLRHDAGGHVFIAKRSQIYARIRTEGTLPNRRK